MAFKKPAPRSVVPESPDRLFRDLPRRKYPSLYDHQGQVLRTYVAEGVNRKDIALQLPTGSGKTLVGLLLAEWRRRKFQEKILFVCPTSQLVNQVVEEATEKYGLTVQGFTGKSSNYTPEAKAAYNSAEQIAVTNYSSLFNIKPFFASPDIVLLDDAHASENYIAANWTVEIRKRPGDPDDALLFDAASAILKNVLSSTSYRRLIGDVSSEEDPTWVDKLAATTLFDIADELSDVISANIAGSEQRYAWRLLSDNLRACQLYIGVNQICIRPLITPTWTHTAFSSAKQRIYMSATLGAGGDLERLTGRADIYRLPIPEGWDRQGIGRRFFVFPDMSLDKEESAKLRLSMMAQAGRSVVLVPSHSSAMAVAEEVRQGLGYPVLTAQDLEKSMSTFVSKERAVAVIANRYDGIDFPDKNCRLLFIEGLPRSTNLQERFLMHRMGAGLLLNERIQTRVFQAVGRCTRGLNDYSAVVVSGDDLSSYVTDNRRRSNFHPELQAEIAFGVEQSKDVTAKTLIENFRIFIEHDTEWENANEGILELREEALQEAQPAMLELAHVVASEIGWQKALWQQDYVDAFDKARDVLAGLAGHELRGYRALWHYLAGGSASAAAKSGLTKFAPLATQQFKLAKQAASGIPWLVSLAFEEEAPESEADKEQVESMLQAENLERHIFELGTVHNRKFNLYQAEIRRLLAAGPTFEKGQEMLGTHLGFDAGKRESDGSPDPWWRLGNSVIVFEAHANAKEGTAIDATKARQAASHIDWVRSFLVNSSDERICSVLVSPATRMTEGAVPSLKKVSFWRLDEFREWSEQALAAVREVRKSLPREGGDLVWRAHTSSLLSREKLDMPQLMRQLREMPACEALEQA